MVLQGHTQAQKETVLLCYQVLSHEISLVNRTKLFWIHRFNNNSDQGPERPQELKYHSASIVRRDSEPERHNLYITINLPPLNI